MAQAAPPQQRVIDESQRVHVDPSFWHSTIVPSGVITQLCSGSFSGIFEKDAFETVMVKHDRLELYRLSKRNTLDLIDSLPLACTIRRVVAVPMATESAENRRHLLCVTSDSGDLTLLRFVPNISTSNDTGILSVGEATTALAVGGQWEVEDRVPFDRSGVRVESAGHYLAADPHGRCVVVGAPLKKKFCFPIRQEGGKLKFDSPLEAHRNSVVFDMIALEVDYGVNPVFATIEAPLETPEDAPQHPPSMATLAAAASGQAVPSMKELIYYEYDIGTNTMVRSWRYPLRNDDATASKLVAVPTGCGPSGVLVCCADRIMWLHRGAAMGLQDYIPRRSDHPLTAGALRITASTLVYLKNDNYFLFLQSSVGDLYRVELNIATTREPNRMYASQMTPPGKDFTIRYYDTTTVARDMLLFRRGQLFVASEQGEHRLHTVKEGYKDDTYLDHVNPPRFTRQPRGHLGHVRSFHGSATTLRGVPRLTKGVDVVTHFHTIQGSGAEAALVTSRQGISTTNDMITPLSVPCNRIWALYSPGAPRRLVVSPAENTAVLIQANADSPFVADAQSPFRLDVPTVACAVLAQGAGLLQIHRDGMRHVGPQRTNDWTHPLRKRILCAACNGRQVIVGFVGGGIAYFELDWTSKSLAIIMEDRAAEAVTVSILSTANDAANTVSDFSDFVGVGLASKEFRVLHAKTLKRATNEKLPYPAPITSSLLTIMADGDLYAFVGMQDGMLIRVRLDKTTGAMKKTDPLMCGKTACTVAAGDPITRSVYAVSSQLWRITSSKVEGLQSTQVIASSLDRVDAAARPDVTAQSAVTVLHKPDGGYHLVHLVATSVVCMNVDTSSRFHHSRVPLCCQPRQLMRVGKGAFSDLLVIAMSGRRAPNADQINAALTAQAATPPNVYAPYTSFAPSPSDPGIPGLEVHQSYLQLYNPETNGLGAQYALPPNEALLSAAVVQFSQLGNEPVIVLGCAREYNVATGSYKSCSLHVFRLRTPDANVQGGVNTFPAQLSLVHITWVKSLPTALCEFNGDLLVGMDGETGLWHMKFGTTKLLRHRTLGDFPGRIVSIQAQGKLICCGTADSSVIIVRDHELVDGHTRSSVLLMVGRDPIQRFVSCTCFIDERTIAVADRFGTLTILRIPDDVPTDIEDEYMTDEMVVLRANQRLKVMASAYVGQVVTSLSCEAGNAVPEAADEQSMAPGDKPVFTRVLYYTTVLGKVGALMPFVSDEDCIAACKLQTELFKKFKTMTGRTPMESLSTYEPGRNVIDGDLVALLDRPMGTPMVSAETAAEVIKAVEDPTKRQSLGWWQEKLKSGVTRAEALLGEDLRPFPTAAQLIQKMKSVPLL